MEIDKVIETTINKDTKTPGGITGALKMHWFNSYKIDYLMCKKCRVYLFRQNSLDMKYTKGSQWSFGAFKKLLCI